MTVVLRFSAKSDEVQKRADQAPIAENSRRINALCSRLLLYGFLEKLHHFTADDVERVAADLGSEGPQPQPAMRETVSVPDAALSARLDRIEQKLGVSSSPTDGAAAALLNYLRSVLGDRDHDVVSG